MSSMSTKELMIASQWMSMLECPWGMVDFSWSSRACEGGMCGRGVHCTE